jgi:hypothetical protein
MQARGWRKRKVASRDGSTAEASGSCQFLQTRRGVIFQGVCGRVQNPEKRAGKILLLARQAETMCWGKLVPNFPGSV